MTLQDDGYYFNISALLSPTGSIFLMAWIVLIALVCLAALVFLLRYPHQINHKICRVLTATTTLSLLTLACELAEFADSSPPIVFWIMQWSALLQLLALVMLNLELFKTFSVLGGYFSVHSIGKMQYCLVSWYFLTLGGQYLSLETLGAPNTPFTLAVIFDDIVV